MSSSSQSQQTPAKASDSKYPSNQQQQRQQPVVPSARPYSSLLLPVSATMPNALHDFSSTIGSPNRYSSIPDWSSHTQTQHSRYPYPLANSTQQFLPHSYSGQSTLPPSFPGQGDLMPSSHIGREQAVAYLDKFASPDAFASPSFDPLTRAAYPQAQSTRLQHQQLQLAQLMGLQQQQQQMQPQFPSPRYSQMPQSFPPTQSAGDSASRLLDDFEQLRRPTRSSREADAFLSRDQDPFSIGAQMGLSGYPMAHSSLNTSIPSDPRAPTITTSTHTVSYSAYPTAQGVMSSQDIAFALMLGGARPANPAHEWLTDNTAPPGIAVNQGPFITSLDTKVPLPASPAGTASSASLASPATANTSISSSFDGFEAPPAGPMAVRTASGASGTPLSSPSTSSPNTSPKTSSSVAGGKRGREESLQSLSQSDPEVESRHFLSPQKPQSLGSRSGPVSPSVSSSVARVPTPSSALTQSFTTISLSSVAPSDAPSDPSSYLFQRPSPSAGLSSSSSTASLPECVSVSSLIFNRSNLSSSSRLGSSSQLPINLDTPSDGSNSPSKRVKPGPSPSSISSGLSLPSSATFLASGVPSLTWPAQSPLSQRTAPSPSSGSAYPFNAVPTNRPSKKAGKAEPKGPKNPRSAYVYFVADQRKKLARTETLANSTFQEVASALGARWRALGPEERRPFEEMARRDKERYQTEKSRSFDDM